MIETTAVNLVKPEPMMVTWDLGRRCNYDCTYCEASRHDNTSPPHSIDELKSTFDFIKNWTEIYNNYRSIDKTNINFTGGEPTVNPKFWELVDYIKNNSSSFNLSLTTNGAWHPKHTKTISEKFAGVTVSYHAEAHTDLKKQVIENIIELKKTGIWMQVNVMLHIDYWDECINLYDRLISLGIKSNPRPIGDGNVVRPGWFVDTNGDQRRTSHSYTPDQQEWFWKKMGVVNSSNKVSEGAQLGRGCCGGRCITAKVDNTWQDVKIINTNFKTWSCMVDWYFLHVDQHTGLIYHHQTCQALHDNKRGAIGNISDKDTLLAQLSSRMKTPTPIICPNTRCGCGMCIPKAKDSTEFNMIFEKNIRSSN